jgi:hypothetical protein
MRARYYNPFLCRFINPDPSGFAGGLNWFAYANGNPVSYLDPFGLDAWTQFMGGLRTLGGGLEAAAGYSLATAGAGLSATGVGAIAGVPLAGVGIFVGAHGLDQVQAGARQAWTGNQVDSFTSQDLQAAGMSQNAANLTDAGISVVGSLGAGLATAPMRAATIAATDPLAAGLSSSEILNTWETGSQALNAADWEALGGNIAPEAALYRGMLIDQGINMTGDSYQLTTTSLQQLGQATWLAPTGLTPQAAAFVAGPGGAIGGLANGLSSSGNSSTGK